MYVIGSSHSIINNNAQDFHAVDSLIFTARHKYMLQANIGPYRIQTPELIAKKLSHLITSARRPAMPIFVQILRRGAFGQMGEI